MWVQQQRPPRQQQTSRCVSLKAQRCAARRRTQVSVQYEEIDHTSSKGTIAKPYPKVWWRLGERAVHANFSMCKTCGPNVAAIQDAIMQRLPRSVRRRRPRLTLDCLHCYVTIDRLSACC
jgi:hypothetical protein